MQRSGPGTCFRLAGRGHGKHLAATFFLAVALGLSVYGTPAHAAAHDYPPKERCTPAALWQDQGRWTQRYYNTHPIQLGWRVLNPRVSEGEKVQLELYSVGYDPDVPARGRKIVGQEMFDCGGNGFGGGQCSRPVYDTREVGEHGCPIKRINVTVRLTAPKTGVLCHTTSTRSDKLCPDIGHGAGVREVSQNHMITLWRGHLKGTHTLPLVYGRYTPYKIDLVSVYGGGNNNTGGSGQNHAHWPTSRTLNVDVGVAGGVPLANRGIHWTLKNVTGRVTERRKVIYYVNGQKRERYIDDAIWVEGGSTEPAVAISWNNTDVSIPAGHTVRLPIDFSGYDAGFDLSLHSGSYVSDPSKVSFDGHTMVLRGPLGTDGRNAFQINATPKADANSVDETVTVALGTPVASNSSNCLMRDGTTRSDVICADQAIPISADTTVSEKQAYVRDAQKAETYEVFFAANPTYVNEQNGPSEPVLKLSKPPRNPISIPVTLVSGTALHEKDFAPAPNEEQEQGIQFSGLSGNFYFKKGNQTATIEIQLNDDDIWEQEEEFYIDIDTTNLPTGVSLKSGASARGTVRIRDNDK
ncbi:MAG: hypothetical protein F4114_18420, partial [Rhodospirillaceae bacterium]|nr:hypothetical protein [Rhodospirillaceae bacterium]